MHHDYVADNEFFTKSTLPFTFSPFEVKNIWVERWNYLQIKDPSTGKGWLKKKKKKKLKSYPLPLNQIAVDFNVFFYSKMKTVSQEAIGNYMDSYCSIN